ncbi:MAG: phosphoribosylamine--glycine ligase [Saprospiraceae bacterium]|uniref:Phosphoribosylamine--glycine ligase n=1 Tax=Candidatus Opimibacter skivensis TaxID=2982028 RepID=A0A9D7XSI3_9BACT|nr:phosphoribosylamine--glycine ligase [Candidatus Opimibacter skivensis]
MNILIIGSGGREHAIADKIASSPLCELLFIAPGNAGTATLGKNIAIDTNDFEAIKSLVVNENINLVVVGPEVPLVAGIVDFFSEDDTLKNIPIIGPSKQGAMLEGSKAFAKEFMQRHQIPTAAYKSFEKNQITEALTYLDSHSMPVVLKADGLAAGKGVLICNTIEESKSEIMEMLSGKFGDASATVVIEEFLTGIEFSVFVLTDGKNYILLPEAKDYKRIGEGDTGLNTGGMGAVSPVPFVDESLWNKVTTQIIEPTIKGITDENINYTGFIFFGLINVNGDPYVIEYNCRLGDPETEVILPRINSDFVEILLAAWNGHLSDFQLKVDSRSAATIMLVSGGYPGDYEKGKIIKNLDHVDGSRIYHAGTSIFNGSAITAGGRVLAVTSLASNMQRAIDKSLINADRIEFEGKYFRRDIGFDL